MTQKPDKTKRRPPGEAPTDGKQDADWGFDAGDGDPSIEKKLGIALVVCLLLGFGFVFFQKYRLLHSDNAQAQVEDATHVEPDDQKPKPIDKDSPQIAAESHGLAALNESTSPADESPFFEPPPQPPTTSRPAAEPTPTEAASWTLTQAEVPQSSLAESTGEALPPLPEKASTGGFDPFLDPAQSAEPTAPQPTPTPNESVAVTWDDDALPLQSEPSPRPQSEPPPAQSEPEPEPFLLDQSSASESQPSAAPAEPSASTPSFAFEDATEPAEPTEPADATEPAEPTEPARDAAPTVTIDPLPPQQEEPQPMASSTPFAAATVESRPSSEAPVQEDAFDPFASSSDPPAAEPPPVPQEVADQPKNPEPFGYLAPPVRDEPARTEPIAAAPAPTPPSAAVVEPPAWPFSESADTNTLQSKSTPSFSPPTTETKPTPAPLESPPAQATPPSPETSQTSGMPPNPFSFDAADSRPIADAIPVGQPAIGEREIVVTPSDSFWSISEREYGSARYFNALAKYNRDRVRAPDKLRSGMTIKVPPPEVLEDKHPELFRASSSVKDSISPISGSSATSHATPPSGLFVDARQRPRYRVGERETLSSIAQQVLGRSSRWTEVYDLNRDQLKSPSTLKIGTVLKLPPDAGRVTVSPAGGFDR